MWYSTFLGFVYSWHVYVSVADECLRRRYDIHTVYIYICKQLDTYTEYTELVAGIIGNHAMQSPESKALRLPCSVASGTNKEVKGLKQRLGMDVSSVGGNIT